MINRRQFFLGGAAAIASVPAVLPQIVEAVLESPPADYLARYTHQTYSLGFAITEEACGDEVMAAYSQALSKSMAQTREAMIANVLNRAFPFGESNADFLLPEGDDPGCCEDEVGFDDRLEGDGIRGDTGGAAYELDNDDPSRMHQLWRGFSAERD